MKHKVPGLVFVLAVALGVVSVAVKTPRPAPIPGVVFAPKAEPEAASLAAAQPTILTKEVPRMDRAAASFRVFENGIVDGMDFRGAQYHARISNTEVRFGTEEGSLLLGNPRIEQGAVTVAGTEPAFTHPAFGTARLERGAFSEEYVFENRRMEQLFHIPAPLGRGALKVSVPLQTSFASVVETRAPNSGTFDAAEFRDGGVAVLDTAGNLKFTCASAVAWDSGKNRITLSPRYEGGRIVMDVPESFMAKAVFPIVIDPWFGSSGSNAAGGLSGTAKTSDRPSMKDNLVAWADSSSGNFEIYARLWTGSGFSDLGGSSTGGGISATPGDSLNPCVASNGSGNPTIAWEEHTGAGVAIFLKQFPRVATGGQWAGLGESATNLGISQNFASNRRPAVGLLQAVVPGIVTINPTNGQPISSPATFPIVPVVAWDSGQIYVSAFYPGAPAIPPVGAAPGLPAVPAGWYQLGKAGGINVTSTFNANLFIGFGQNSSLVVDGLNQVTVAWDGVLGNNVEIQASRWTLANPGNPTEFQIVAASISQFNMLPAASFAGIAVPGAPFDNVSGTATPSQFPSLCLDGVGGLAIAWQETEAQAPPNPGTSSQIYLRRSTGGAWAGLAGSANGGGISRTGTTYDGAGQTPPVPGNASTPSVDSGGGYLGVAWADTSNGRSSIYVRRCLVLGGATWEQVGFQGSAFPPQLPLIAPPAVPEPSPINGVSKSPNYSYQPQIQMGVDGSPIVAWADGSGATFDILATSFWPNGPGQAVNVGTNSVDFQLTIQQTSTDPTLPGGGTVVPIAGFTTGTSIFLSSRVFSETVVPPAISMWLEIELQPVGTPFSLRANRQVLFQAPDLPPTVLPAPAPTSLAVIQIDGLPNENYHYITRTVDNLQRVSPWFEQTNVGGVSFRVNSSAAGGGSNGPTNNAPVVGSTKGKGNCGLLGLESIALLGLIRIIRRKRSK